MSSSRFDIRDGNIVAAKPKGLLNSFLLWYIIYNVLFIDMIPIPLDRRVSTLNLSSCTLAEQCDTQGKNLRHPAVVTDSSHPHRHTVAPISTRPIAPYKATADVVTSIPDLRGFIHTNPVQISKSKMEISKRPVHGRQVTADELKEIRGLQAATQAKGPMLQELRERFRREREGKGHSSTKKEKASSSNMPKTK
jgi:hypothetical protein